MTQLTLKITATAATFTNMSKVTRISEPIQTPVQMNVHTKFGDGSSIVREVIYHAETLMNKDRRTDRLTESSY